MNEQETPNLWEQVKPFKTELYGKIDIEAYLDLDGLMKVVYLRGVAEIKARVADAYDAGINDGISQGEIVAWAEADEMGKRQLADQRSQAHGLAAAANVVVTQFGSWAKSLNGYQSVERLEAALKAYREASHAGG